MKFKLEQWMEERGIKRESVIGQVPVAYYIEILSKLAESE